MLRRKLIMLVGAGILGANINFASAESPFPPSSEDVLYQLLPAEEQYFKERESVALTGQQNQRRAANSLAGQQGERAVKVTAATKYLNIEDREIVKIENDKGQSFIWTADTGEANFPLQTIAPKGFVAGPTRVFVSDPYAYATRD